MTKRNILMILGILVVFIPFLGIPGLWKNILFVLLGSGVLFLGFRLRHRAVDGREVTEHALLQHSDTYVENETLSRVTPTRAVDSISKKV